MNATGKDDEVLFALIEEMIECDASPFDIIAAVRAHSKDKPRRKRSSDDALFDEFWAAYPKRQGSNPKSPALKSWKKAMISGGDPSKIILAIKSGIGYDKSQVGTPYIPQAVKWLNDRRWEDDGPTPVVNGQKAIENGGLVWVKAESPEWKAWEAHHLKTEGIHPVCHYSKERKEEGWWFKTRWPPGHENH